MGERATIDQDYLYDIADAIREKKGVTTRFMPAEMKPAILAIPTGGDVDVEALSVTANGTYTAPTGKAYSPVTVNVSGGGGTAILSGKAEPTASVGSNGDIYLQYVDGIDIFGTPTSNNPPNGVINATSTYTSYSPYKGFGNNDGWGAEGGNGTLTYTFTSESYKPSFLSFVDYFDVSGGYLKANTFTFEGSDDGVNWDILYTKSEPATTKDTVKTVALATQKAYSRFRFVVDGGSGYAGIKNVVCLDEESGISPIVAAFCKVNGSWQVLIGTNINDVGGLST